MERLLIGKGGFGSVYLHPAAPHFVEKETHNGHLCKDLGREYNLQQSAHKAVQNVLLTVPDLPIDVPRPSDWQMLASGKDCSYRMERVIPPDCGTLAWHVYLGTENDSDTIVYSENSIRGRYLGVNGLRTALASVGTIPPNADKLAYWAGTLISTVQYGSLQTALDTELIIGRPGECTDALRLYLIDYDRSTEWEDDNPPIETLSFALESEPYYPYRSRPGYDSFRKGYLEIAEMYHKTAIAEQVLETFD